MSQVPLREALRALAAEGWVVRYPQRGYRVAELAVADYEDASRLRLALDPMATGLAAEERDQSELEAIATALDHLAAAFDSGDREAYDEAHRDFHFSLYAASHSPWLIRFIGMLWDHTARYQRLQIQAGLEADRMSEHRAIYEAVAAGDPERATAAMRGHLERALGEAPALPSGGAVPDLSAAS